MQLHPPHVRTYLTGELEHVGVEFVARGCAQIPDVPQRDGSLANTTLGKLLTVIVLDSDHAFVRCAMQNEPPSTPFLQMRISK